MQMFLPRLYFRSLMLLAVNTGPIAGGNILPLNYSVWVNHPTLQYFQHFYYSFFQIGFNLLLLHYLLPPGPPLNFYLFIVVLVNVVCSIINGVFSFYILFKFYKVYHSFAIALIYDVVDFCCLCLSNVCLVEAYFSLSDLSCCFKF